MNRIEQYFRDPTLDEPGGDFFVVRVPWDCFVVNRDSAARILIAVSSQDRPEVIRCETITGSTVYIRTDTVMFVRESTRAQRDAERRFWKQLDDEDSDEV